MKKGLEEKKDIAGLLNILIDNCQTYKYKLGNFLEFMRLQAGLNRTVRGTVNLRRLLNQVIDEYETHWIDKEAHIRLDISSALPDELSCDEGRILLIVSNLFVNAIGFSPMGSAITIAAGFSPQTGPRGVAADNGGPPVGAADNAGPPAGAADNDLLPGQKPADRWTISVSDNGDGMTEQQLEAAFATMPARRTILRNGAGLGLVVSRRLAEDVLGGRLWLESRPGKGTEAWLELPFYPCE
jgi:signal transduction histidine kinase